MHMWLLIILSQLYYYYYYHTYAQSCIYIFPNQCHLFSEPDRQNNGKACILSDTTRILKDLLSQVESLRKENNTLKNESHYVSELLLVSEI
jgi:hypothetical protein